MGEARGGRTSKVAAWWGQGKGVKGSGGEAEGGRARTLETPTENYSTRTPHM